MKHILERLIEEAFDSESLEEALKEEIADRIDYREIAENICDEYDSFISETVSDLAGML